jgi:hypothetical protein
MVQGHLIDELDKVLIIIDMVEWLRYTLQLLHPKPKQRTHVSSNLDAIKKNLFFLTVT